MGGGVKEAERRRKGVKEGREECNGGRGRKGEGKERGG